MKESSPYHSGFFMFSKYWKRFLQLTFLMNLKKAEKFGNRICLQGRRINQKSKRNQFKMMLTVQFVGVVTVSYTLLLFFKDGYSPLNIAMNTCGPDVVQTLLNSQAAGRVLVSGVLKWILWVLMIIDIIYFVKIKIDDKNLVPEISRNFIG